MNILISFLNLKTILSSVGVLTNRIRCGEYNDLGQNEKEVGNALKLHLYNQRFSAKSAGNKYLPSMVFRESLLARNFLSIIPVY
jgi:hypothetical protein